MSEPVNVISDIKSNYLQMEKEIVTQLNYLVNNHPLTSGTNREEIWRNFFERIVPKKFSIARSVFIIDSNGECSKEVDLAIYDEDYTPYIFNYGVIKFIPIEAVAAVIQCKSENLGKKNLEEWVGSIEKLKTSNKSVVRLVTDVFKDSDIPTRKSTKPIIILCHMAKNIKEEIKDIFDIVISSSKSANSGEGLVIDFNSENNKLYDIFCKYNGFDSNPKNEKVQKTLGEMSLEEYVVEGGYNLLSFIFQFNQMLMLINNPLFFPHRAYVGMFNKK